jgi:hypothetical protein
VVVLDERLARRQRALLVPFAPVGLDEEAPLVTVNSWLEGDEAGKL